MTDFFRERTTALKIILESRHDYRQRFYHQECLWDSRSGVVSLSESEKIESVLPSGVAASVVTTGTHPNHRSRYHVKPSGESWLIQEVDTECSFCNRTPECPECGGSGWQSGKDWYTRYAQRHDRAKSRSSNEELEGCVYLEPAIEQFMADHFRERTATLQMEMKIHANYAKRFYSPEFDWSRFVVSVQGSEAERVVNVVLVKTGAQVITRDFCIWGLRYNLRPGGQSWLIWEVDSECPNAIGKVEVMTVFGVEEQSGTTKKEQKDLKMARRQKIFPPEIPRLRS